MSKVPQEKKFNIFYLCYFFLIQCVLLLSTFGKKSSDFLVCAHTKVNILIIENKNDSFLVFKNTLVNPLNFMKAQLALVCS